MNNILWVSNAVVGFPVEPYEGRFLGSPTGNERKDIYIPPKSLEEQTNSVKQFVVMTTIGLSVALFFVFPALPVILTDINLQNPRNKMRFD